MKQHFLCSEQEFLEIQDTWRDHWKDMPEYVQLNTDPIHQIVINFDDESKVIVSFVTLEDLQTFGNLIGQKLTTFTTHLPSSLFHTRNQFSKIVKQKITDNTKSVWFPEKIYLQPKNFLYVHESKDIDNKYLPKYPIYIISKGRADSRLTSKSLEEMNIDYYIVIEPQEYKEYAKYIDKDKILTLPFSNMNRGSIPARNWVKNHSKKNGDKRHWILDDNINGFVRFGNNTKIKVTSPAIFRAIEDFCDRYENIEMSGMNYRYFAAQSQERPPFTLNTRIYSCILLDNNCKFNWRGRYNEDTDLSLRILKSGKCTVLFNAFLCNKAATLTMKGGNTDTLYNQTNNRLEFAQSLKNQHPDCVEVVERYGRFHHEVNYEPFKQNKLIKRVRLELTNKINNYGMILKTNCLSLKYGLN